LLVEHLLAVEEVEEAVLPSWGEVEGEEVVEEALFDQGSMRCMGEVMVLRRQILAERELAEDVKCCLKHEGSGTMGRDMYSKSKPQRQCLMIDGRLAICKSVVTGGYLWRGSQPRV
jgi:hypothetical protein